MCPVAGKPRAQNTATGASPHKVVGFLPRSQKCMTGDGEKDEIQIQIDRPSARMFTRRVAVEWLLESENQQR